MRKIYFAILMTGILIALAAPLKAQISFNLSIGNQPAWGPVGYDEVQYYYIPDIDAYYYVPQHRFYFYEGGRWVGRSSLPSRYRNYDLYNSYKVVINEREPWRNHETYRQKYASYKGRHDQQPIRDSRDQRYFVNKNHPEHNTWVKQQKHDNGNGRGQGNGNHGNNGNRGNNGNKDKQNRHDNGNGKGNGNHK